MVGDHGPLVEQIYHYRLTCDHEGCGKVSPVVWGADIHEAADTLRCTSAWSTQFGNGFRRDHITGVQCYDHSEEGDRHRAAYADMLKAQKPVIDALAQGGD